MNIGGQPRGCVLSGTVQSLLSETSWSTQCSTAKGIGLLISKKLRQTNTWLRADPYIIISFFGIIIFMLLLNEQNNNKFSP